MTFPDSDHASGSLTEEGDNLVFEVRPHRIWRGHVPVQLELRPELDKVAELGRYRDNPQVTVPKRGLLLGGAKSHVLMLVSDSSCGVMADS